MTVRSSFCSSIRCKADENVHLIVLNFHAWRDIPRFVLLNDLFSFVLGSKALVSLSSHESASS